MDKEIQASQQSLCQVKHLQFEFIQRINSRKVRTDNFMTISKRKPYSLATPLQKTSVTLPGKDYLVVKRLPTNPSCQTINNFKSTIEPIQKQKHIALPHSKTQGKFHQTIESLSPTESFFECKNISQSRDRAICTAEPRARKDDTLYNKLNYLNVSPTFDSSLSVSSHVLPRTMSAQTIVSGKRIGSAIGGTRKSPVKGKKRIECVVIPGSFVSESEKEKLKGILKEFASLKQSILKVEGQERIVALSFIERYFGPEELQITEVNLRNFIAGIINGPPPIFPEATMQEIIKSLLRGPRPRTTPQKVRVKPKPRKQAEPVKEVATVKCRGLKIKQLNGVLEKIIENNVKSDEHKRPGTAYEKSTSHSRQHQIAKKKLLLEHVMLERTRKRLGEREYREKAVVNTGEQWYIRQAYWDNLMTKKRRLIIANSNNGKYDSIL